VLKMTEDSEIEDTKLLEFTRMFWSDFCSDDFSSVEALLSPDCCIRLSFSENDLGICGKEECLNYLKEIHMKLKMPISRLDTSQLQHLRLMPSCKQTRFMISGKPGHISSNMGFAIDWQCEMIIDFVIMKNTSASMFLSTNSEKGPQQDQSEDDNWLTRYMRASSDAPERSASNTDSLTTSQRRPSVRSSTSYLVESLQPPFLHPKPPAVPPTVTVTILECTNLKSRLVRVISRPVSAFVTVELGGVKRRTETAKYNNYPCYDSTNSFLFEISDSDREEGVLHFTVMDEHLINDDILAETDVPLASLRASVDNHTPYEIKLPLVLGETHFGLALSSNNALDDEPPMMRVRISKVDVLQWWAEKEVALRKEQDRNLRTITPTSTRGASATTVSPSSKDVKASRRHTMGPMGGAGAAAAAGVAGSDMGGTGGALMEARKAPKSEWVDSKHVVICME
jgi:hypothetical protein